jgi:hypothetical protein
MPDTLWTNSQKNAWDYVRSATNEGLRQTEALEAYRSGGGAIRTSSWGELWHRYNEGAETWGKISLLKTSDTVPESYFTETDINYRSKYTMQFQANIRTEDGTIVHDIYRNVGSNRRLTLKEWLDAISETVKEDLSSPGVDVIEVKAMDFYTT